MGLIHVTASVRNPADISREWQGLFLVDTGAVDCRVPRKHLEAIGIKPAKQQSYELADGTELKMDVAGAEIEFMGDKVWVAVIFGPDDVEPIMGVLALESAGIEVDPRSQRLKRLPALSLKNVNDSPE